MHLHPRQPQLGATTAYFDVVGTPGAVGVTVTNMNDPSLVVEFVEFVRGPRLYTMTTSFIACDEVLRLSHGWSLFAR